MKQYQKILLGVLILIILLLSATKIYVSYYLDDRLEKEAITHFNDNTNNKFNLEIGDTGLSIIGRELSFNDIKVTQKKADSAGNLTVTLESFNLSGIGFLPLLWSNELSIRNVELNTPVISLIKSEKSSDSEESPELNTLSTRLAKKVLQNLNSLSIQQLTIRELSVDFQRSTLPVDSLLSFSNSDIEFYNIVIDSTALEDNRVLPIDNLAATFRDIQFNTPNQLYQLTVDQAEFSTSNGKMNLRAIRMEPRIEKGDFSDHVGHEIDRMTMIIDEISWNEINIDRLNRADGLFVKDITLDRPSLNIYHDKRPPFPPGNHPPLPQQMIRYIPIPVAIDSISLVNGHIRYNERQPKAEKPGYIDFANLKAYIVNLSNIKDRWSEEAPPTMHAEADIMNRGRLKVDFIFPMIGSEDIHHVNGSLGAMDLQPLNVAFEPLAFARVDGRILGMEFHMRLGEKESTGEVTLLYENVDITLLDKDTNEQNLGSEIKSLLANAFVVQSANKGDDIRSGKIDFERVERKSVFNYWWKSLLSGIKSNVTP